MHDAEQTFRVATQLLSSGLIVALGILVLSVRPRTAASTAFGIFAILEPLPLVILSVVRVAHAPVSDGVMLARAAAHLAIALAVARLLFVFPKRTAPTDRWPVVASAALGAAAFAGGLHRVSLYGVPDAWHWYFRANVLNGAVLAALLSLLSMRFLRAQDEPERRSFALACAGTLLATAYLAGISITETTRSEPTPFLVLAVLAAAAPFGVIAVVFLLATRGASSATARNMALLTLGLMLLAMTIEAAGVNPFNLYGTMRVASVAVLAYAVLRGKILDVDVKLRWGISKSTLAAAFIAVFFLVSEGAQILFGQQNEVVGLLAAGALVFLLAPLQRAADRLAERAVPLAAPGHATVVRGVLSGREEAYRDALRVALKDRKLDRDEEVKLHRLAGELGIEGVRAHQILVEVERERDGADPAETP